MPEISVLLPCYNAADTLPEALDSLSRQTYADFEIIAVDDGSTDDTGEILRDWSAREPRLRVLRQEHGGVIAAANAGLGQCRGKYVARMDADDRCPPERLAKQAAYLEEYPEVDVVSCLVAGFPEEEVREGFRIYLEWLNSLTTNEAIRREMFVECPIPNPTAMFRREVFERVGLYEERGWPEDYDLFLRLYLAGGQFAKVPEVLYEWREHPERLTRVDPRYSVENFLRAKSHYLARGPLMGRDGVIVWGAGMMGRRLSKHLLRAEVPLIAFVDIDPKKIGRRRRGKPILAPEALPEWRERYENPAVLAAVGARGARELIRARLNRTGLVEGRDWWGVA